jgi:hypothetical protein
VGEVRNPDVFAHFHAEMSHTITIVHRTHRPGRFPPPLIFGGFFVFMLPSFKPQ